MIDLAKVRSNFDRRALHFLNAAAAASAPNLGRKEVDRLVAHTIVELETSIAYAARTSYLAGSLGGRTASGTRLGANAPTVLAALRSASIAVGKNPRQIPGRDEPSWASANHVSQVAQVALPTNGADIIAAMGVFPSARKCVKAFRNFFAHRGHSTLGEAWTTLGAEYGLVWRGHPTGGLLALSPGGASSMLETWIWNYVDIVHALCG